MLLICQLFANKTAICYACFNLHIEKGVIMKSLKKIFLSLYAVVSLVAILVSVGLLLFIFSGDKKIYKNYVEVVVSDREPVLLNEEAQLRRKIMDAVGGAGERSKPPTEGTFVVIPITGPIFNSNDSEYREILEQLFIASNLSQNVKAVIFWVDSPGGGVTASDDLFMEISSLRIKGIKTVSFIHGLSASGAYYATAFSDRMIASPTAIVGSIGVIIKFFNFRKLAKGVGVEVETVKSSEMKDIGSPFKRMSGRERAVFEKLIQHSFVRFKMIVKLGRLMSEQEVDEVATGEVWSASDAKDKHLVDRVGYFDEAIVAAVELTGVENPKIIAYQKQPGFLDSVMDKLNGLAGEPSVSRKVMKEISETPQLLYEWCP